MTICKGKTKAGKRCQRKIKDDEEYCNLHKPAADDSDSDSDVKSSKKKTVKSGKKKESKRKPKEESSSESSSDSSSESESESKSESSSESESSSSVPKKSGKKRASKKKAKKESKKDSDSDSNSDDSSSSESESDPTPKKKKKSKKESKKKDSDSDSDSSPEDSDSSSSESNSDSSSRSSSGSSDPDSDDEMFVHPKYKVPMKVKPFDYQETAIDYCIARMRIKHYMDGGRYQEGAPEPTRDMTPNDESFMRGVLLSAEQGLGKTFMSLIMLMYNKLQNPDLPTSIVISPKIVATTTWPNEIKKFFGDKIKYLILHGDKMNTSTVTIKQLEKYDVVITTPEFLQGAARVGYTKFSKKEGRPGWHKDEPESITRGYEKVNEKEMRYFHPVDVPEWKGKKSTILGPMVIFDYKWNTVVFDESQKGNNSGTATFRSFMGLCGQYYLTLSGTPVANYASKDLPSQLMMLGLEMKANKTEFTSFYQNSNIREWFYRVTIETSGIKIPEPKFEKMLIDLGKSKGALNSESNSIHRGLYDALHQRLNDEYDDRKAAEARGETKAEFSEILALITRLRQVCIAPFMITAKAADEAGREFNDSIDIFRDINKSVRKWIENSPDASWNSPVLRETARYLLDNPQPTIIFSMFPAALDMLRTAMKKRAHKKGMKRPQISFIDQSVSGQKRTMEFNRFIEGKTQTLMFSFKLGGTGLNITKATRVLFLDQWYSPAAHEQAFSRSYRLGQKEVVTKVDVLVKRTIMSKILEINLRKLEEAKIFMGDKKGNNNAGLDSSTLAELLGGDMGSKIEDEDPEEYEARVRKVMTKTKIEEESGNAEGSRRTSGRTSGRRRPKPESPTEQQAPTRNPSDEFEEVLRPKTKIKVEAKAEEESSKASKSQKSKVESKTKVKEESESEESDFDYASLRKSAQRTSGRR